MVEHGQLNDLLDVNSLLFKRARWKASVDIFASQPANHYASSSIVLDFFPLPEPVLQAKTNIPFNEQLKSHTSKTLGLKIEQSPLPKQFYEMGGHFVQINIYQHQALIDANFSPV